MKVKEIMSSPIMKISAGATVADAAKIMDSKNIGSLPVEENRELVGIITERDILRKIVAKGRDAKNTLIKDVMTTPILTISAEDSVEEANETMALKKIRRLPVESDGDIVGIITLTDVSNSLRYSLGKDIVQEKGTNHYRPSL